MAVIMVENMGIPNMITNIYAKHDRVLSKTQIAKRP